MFGSVFFMYEKKQSAMFTGIALMPYPYIISSVVWVVIIGVVLTAISHFVRNERMQTF